VRSTWSMTIYRERAAGQIELKAELFVNASTMDVKIGSPASLVLGAPLGLHLMVIA